MAALSFNLASGRFSPGGAMTGGEQNLRCPPAISLLVQRRARLPVFLVLLLLVLVLAVVFLAVELAPARDLRAGSFFRFVLATSLNFPSLIDSYMLREAPLREDLDLPPRLAVKAAPAAICCFFDFAGMDNSGAGAACSQLSEGKRLAIIGLFSGEPGWTGENTFVNSDRIGRPQKGLLGRISSA
jgi:hypothetical protein